MSLKITKASVANADTISNFFMQIGEENISINNRFFENEGNIMLIAFSDDIACGIAYAYILSSINKKEPMMFLYSIDVLPEYQNRGIGSALIERLKEIAIDHNCFEMFVLTNDSNTLAKKLYERTGGIRENLDDLMYVYPL